MGIVSFLCVFLGINYGVLYSLLPFPIEYAPYTFDHIVGQMQLLLAALFAFCLLVRLGWYPAERDTTILDTDWIYRRLGDGAVRWGVAMTQRLIRAINRLLSGFKAGFTDRLFHIFSPAGALARDFPSGLMALWTAILLALVLVVAYISSF